MFPPPPLIANLDSADRQYNGNDEEQDSADESSRHGSPFDVVGHVVSELLTEADGTDAVGHNAEDVGLCGAHVFDCRK